MKKATHKIVCKNCGKEFLNWNCRKSIFCSMRCYGKYKSKHITEFGNFKGKHHTKRTREKLGTLLRGYVQTEKYHTALSEAAKHRGVDVIRKRLFRRGKSSLEEKFEILINKYNLPYRFVGDGKFQVERKVPDFINTNGEKIAIEVYYRRHKEQFRDGLDKWKKDRTIVFKNYGWKLLFFDETMVNEDYIIKTLNGGETNR